MSDWNAEQYLKYCNERTQPARDLVSRIRHPRPEKIIDIGCGPGNSTKVLAERFPNAIVQGADNSKDMLAAAKRDHPELEFWFCDASRDLGNIKESYEVVFSNACLQWVPDHPKLIENIMGMLKTGGVMAVQIPYNFQEPVHGIILQLAVSDKWKGFLKEIRPFYTLTPEDYCEVLTRVSSGFDIWEITYMHIMPSHEAILEWYRSTGLRPYLDSLPQNLKSLFEADFLHNVRLAYPKLKDGRILFRFPRLFWTAIK